jgi:hypothetical protein
VFSFSEVLSISEKVYHFFVYLFNNILTADSVFRSIVRNSRSGYCRGFIKIAVQ